MNKVKTIKVYNLVDSKGNKLQLELGMTDVQREDKPWDSADKGYRWRFIGKHIPMPVRSMYWFNGFAEPVMLDWLKANGWYPHTCVEMCCGYAKVYELPKGDEIPDHVVSNGEVAVKDAIKMFCEAGRVLRAVQLYRYVVNPSCSLAEAKYAVDAIRLDKQP